MYYIYLWMVSDPTATISTLAIHWTSWYMQRFDALTREKVKGLYLYNFSHTTLPKQWIQGWQKHEKEQSQAHMMVPQWITLPHFIYTISLDFLSPFSPNNIMLSFSLSLFFLFLKRLKPFMHHVPLYSLAETIKLIITCIYGQKARLDPKLKTQIMGKGEKLCIV